ncbi:MAG: hypothetical protein OEL76_04505 [Siculibacillus sp.]|nr:hypothetical protein [Siculibacillus sp.]
MDWVAFTGPTVVAALVSGVVAWLTTRLTISFNREKMEREFKLEFATEAAIRVLLSDGTYNMRSFSKIKHHLPGFEKDDELRRYLIRAGAVCFTNESEDEMWGLLVRHKGEAFK